MYAITREQFHAEVEPILRQVFVDYQPRFPSYLFSDEIPERLMIYPCLCEIESIAPETIMGAVAQAGDEGCYFYTIDDAEDRDTCCYVPLSEFVKGYAGEPGSEELIGARLHINVYGSQTCIFSPRGEWGIRSTREWVGFLGGSQTFINVIRELTPNLEQQVYSYLEHLRSGLFGEGFSPPDVARIP